jgi:translation initiation factor 1 (eIF-1/SUI1)
MNDLVYYHQVIQLQGDQRKNVATFLVQVIYETIAYCRTTYSI